MCVSLFLCVLFSLYFSLSLSLCVCVYCTWNLLPLSAMPPPLKSAQSSPYLRVPLVLTEFSVLALVTLVSSPVSSCLDRGPRERETAWVLLFTPLTFSWLISLLWHYGEGKVSDAVDKHNGTLSVQMTSRRSLSTPCLEGRLPIPEIHANIPAACWGNWEMNRWWLFQPWNFSPNLCGAQVSETCTYWYTRNHNQECESHCPLNIYIHVVLSIVFLARTKNSENGRKVMCWV